MHLRRVWLLGFSLTRVQSSLPKKKRKWYSSIQISIPNFQFVIAAITNLLSFWHSICDIFFAAVAQDIQNQEEVGEEDEAEQAYPLLDPHEDRQHHQVLNLPLAF